MKGDSNGSTRVYQRSVRKGRGKFAGNFSQDGTELPDGEEVALQEDWNEDGLPRERPVAYPVLERFIPTINRWLEADRKIPRKQRHTAKRIYTRLVAEEGFTGSYSSVKKYVRKKKQAMNMAAEGYLPLAQPSGHGQVDFGECLYYDAQGQEKKGYALTVTFPYSNKGYTQFFPGQNQECLLTGLQRIFEHIGGVPARLRFDNLPAAVTQVLKGTDRVLADGFTRFMLHYRFQADFCNPDAGNEKGNVENKVGYNRRNFFVPVPTITSFDAFNLNLWDRCEDDAQRLHYKHRRPIQELWEEERGSLLALPEYPFSIFRYEALAVDKCGFVRVDTNKYGLSPALTGKTVQAKIFYDRVSFFYDHNEVGTYPRSYGKHQELCDWTRYMRTLCMKPGAVEHTRFFEQMPKLWQQYLAQSKGRERTNALKLLREIVEDGNVSLCDELLTKAAQSGRTDPDSLRQYYCHLAKERPHPEPLQLQFSPPALNYNPDLDAYDGLMRGGENHA